MNEEEFNEMWGELEKSAREKFETVLQEGKRMWRKTLKPPTKKKELPVLPIKILVVDADYGLPLYVATFSVFGTHQEIAQLIENRMSKYLKDFQKSLSYKRSLYRLYVELVDEYKMSPVEIYPLLHADYDNLSAGDKRSFQNNLRTNYTRLTRNKKPKK